ncbi:hypothetical protein [Arthrobacter cryoconiti]|uniref:Uncharacterized protein n=1 Tax=Arthrobacter cryoconiti TaxID=748907 RepID=A0ABV8R045_9MICC|nr:hypothetical protein [Arthrobacter cryoconiti]MCC9068381.1 hypothetical protein [Arthrobacter cryoconiti]
MSNVSNEPVEISTKMLPGEWTEESMNELVGSYQQKIRDMGAPEDQINTSVETLDDGSANVRVSWHRTGVQTFANMGQSAVSEAANSRGHGEHIPAGETTKDSKGLGAILGDAERSAIDEPSTQRAVDAQEDTPAPNLVVYTDEEGKTYAEDVGPVEK